MKTTTNKITMTAAGLSVLVLSACGSYNKEPVGDIQQLRDNAKKENQRGAEQPQIVTREKEKIVYRDRIVEKPVIQYKIVEKPVEQYSVNDNPFVIVPDSEMSFVEGQSSSAKIRVLVLFPGAKVKLVAQNLPAGAKLESDDKETDTYTISWQPGLGLVGDRAAMKKVPVKLSLNIVSVKNEADRKLLEKLSREKTVDLFVFHDQAQPSEVQVKNLPSVIDEGTLTSFEVTAKIPGVDDKSAQKPRLNVTYDGVSISAGNDFQELDGSRHVVQNSGAEYLGNSVWRFSRVFDTKTVGAQAQVAKDGSIMNNADGTRVRVSFKVYSPFGSSSAEVVSKIKIRYDKPVAAPRFDMTAIGETLVLKAGQDLSLQFRVESTDRRSSVKVQLPELKNLPFEATAKCSASKDGAFSQICVLTFFVPCTATAADLKQELKFSANATVGNDSGETVTQTLKTSGSPEVSKACKAVAAPAPAAPVEQPAPQKEEQKPEQTTGGQQ